MTPREAHEALYALKARRGRPARLSTSSSADQATGMARPRQGRSRRTLRGEQVHAKRKPVKPKIIVMPLTKAEATAGPPSR